MKTSYEFYAFPKMTLEQAIGSALLIIALLTASIISLFVAHSYFKNPHAPIFAFIFSLFIMFFYTISNKSFLFSRKI